MSLYNMIAGVNPAAFFILPMLGEKHPDSYPRFRDCFVTESDVNKGEYEIHVFTRVGGGNRDCGFGEEELKKHPNFVRDFDDDFDNTFATYCFSIPEEWKDDFRTITIDGNLPEISEKYKERLYKVYPKLKEQLDEIFQNDGQEN